MKQPSSIPADACPVCWTRYGKAQPRRYCRAHQTKGKPSQ